MERKRPAEGVQGGDELPRKRPEHSRASERGQNNSHLTTASQYALQKSSFSIAVKRAEAVRLDHKAVQEGNASALKSACLLFDAECLKSLAKPTVRHLDDSNVCYGMVSCCCAPRAAFRLTALTLSRIKCRARSHLSEPLKCDFVNLPSSEPPGYVHFSLWHREGRYLITHPTDGFFADINCKVATALDELGDLTSIQLHPYEKESRLTSLVLTPSLSSRSSMVFSVNINIYGPCGSSEAIGEILSRHSLYIQDPYLLNKDLEYVNPHIFQFKNIPEGELLSNFEDLTASQSHSRKEKPPWSEVLDHLPDFHGASSVQVHDFINVQLKKHQLDALEFMLQREMGVIGQQFSYWQLDQNEDLDMMLVINGLDLPYDKIRLLIWGRYRHTVTGAETIEPPKESKGGILALAMGLGKTLTAITVVASSLDRGRTFAADYGDVTRHTHQLNTRIKSTLVVVPSVLILKQWEDEISRRTKTGALLVTRYHGHDRVRHFGGLLEYDIVLTTYGTVAKEHRKSSSRKALFHVEWFRIVLDEAHTIRSQDTKQFKAIMALQAKHHWCLTGTPISNRVEDVGSLLRFCRAPLLEDRACFREYIVKPARTSFLQGCELLRKALSPLCLRRAKNFRHETTFEQCTITFSSSERRDYNNILRQSKRDIDSMISGSRGTLKKHTVLQAILQLRLFCNHGLTDPIKTRSKDENLDPDETLTLLQEGEATSCVFCCSDITLLNQLEDNNSGLLGVCNHVLCRSCFQDDIRNAEAGCFFCPECKKQMKVKRLNGSGRDDSGYRVQPSTKLVRVIENLVKLKGHEKSLVFSVWKKTIDRTSELCARSGISHVCIHGKTSQSDRVEALDKFANDPHTTALLMTLGTGALGLNLTTATIVHILEPQWNPIVEHQAIARAVRLGQERNTSVIRYIVTDSVEQQIQGYQKKKNELAAGGLGEGSWTEPQIDLLTATFFNDTTAQNATAEPSDNFHSLPP